MKIKPLTLLFLVFLTWNQLSAAILTVNNSNPSPGQYSDLQVAIDAAQAGDTLLIHRSATSYGNATITKRLTLIGEGALPNKTPLNASTLGNITLTYNTSNLEHASKSKLIGLNIVTLNINEKSTDLNYSCDSIIVSYCKISGLNPKNKSFGIQIEYSIINLISGGSLNNWKLSNNIIYSINSLNSDGSNNLLINNLFFFRIMMMGGVAVNNIFYSASTPSFVQNCKNIIFSNNIMGGGATIFNPSDYTINGNNSINNQFNVDPLFINPVSFSVLNTYTHTVPAAGPFANFHLQAGSPAIGAGTDGTDLGIYGGASPWRDGANTDSRFRYFPLPDAVPVITGLSVPNPVVNAGGTLQIQLNATTQP